MLEAGKGCVFPSQTPNLLGSPKLPYLRNHVRDLTLDLEIGEAIYDEEMKLHKWPIAFPTPKTRHGVGHLEPAENRHSVVCQTLDEKILMGKCREWPWPCGSGSSVALWGGAKTLG